MEILGTISTATGLSVFGSFGPLLAGVLLLFVLVRLFSLSLRLVWNGIVGALMLWLVNLLGALAGFNMEITVLKAFIAGFFGIPGALGVVLFEIYGK